ncbi:aminoglycoside phosphotransferase family protein [Ktedonospora formicarum]|uniref:Streptomycin 6-kinase n=1 Tax=Ktedonospora formicarum TaxID=2778364 RepID=A0A8J3MUB8_9CHLR|nr:aminoglycoside phosphotransferase family protein [Ktedonospora formicarum]GHO46766.1 streptomycin 6-kinase [Ktedonospora formicarum]
MRERMIELPWAVRQKVATLGEEGLWWVEGLGELIEVLEQEWDMSVGKCLAGGSEAYVAEARMGDGSEAILKLAMPEMVGNTVFENEVQTFAVADGHGYARLIRHDLTRRAMLLERLGTPLMDLGYATNTQIEIICTTLKAAWTHRPPASLLQTGTGVAEALANFITTLWEELGRPVSKRAYHKVLSFARSREAAFDPQSAVLVHGDAHSGNILQDLSQPQPAFKFIDPDGFVAEPAYDLSIPMREWCDELLADPVSLGRERCDYLSHLTGVDPQGIWEWGFIQSMSHGLFLLKVGQVQAGRKVLQVAEAWARV